MTTLLQRIRDGRSQTRSSQIMDGYFGGLVPGSFMFNGQPHQLGSNMPGSPPDRIGPQFEHLIQQVHRRHGVVAAAVMARELPLSQLVFRWRVEAGTREGRLIGTDGLAPLERPGGRGGWTRPEMLRLAERHGSYAGNAYFRRLPDDRIQLLRPDWVDLLAVSQENPNDALNAGDVQIVGYAYWPGGRDAKRRQPPRLLTTAEVAHWRPELDPLFPWLGESWVLSVIREVTIDGQATDHTSKFYENATVGRHAWTAPEGITEAQFKEWAKATKAVNAGAENAWKDLYMSAGTGLKQLSASYSDLKMSDLQGAVETRMATRSRVPATMLGIREGMAGSALNSGNYGATRRMWADGFFHPHADSLCAALESIVPPPNAGLTLTFDPDRVLLLQEDRKDAADILATQATAIGSLHAAGFEPDAAVRAVTDGNLAALVGQHTGLSSVQLLPPEESAPNDEGESDGQAEAP